MGFEVGKENRHQDLWDQQPIPTKEFAPENRTTKPVREKRPVPAKQQKHSVVAVILLTFVFLFLAIIISGVLVAIRR